MKRIVFATILLLLITACNNTKVDSRLTHIEQLMRAHPDSALTLLQEIDSRQLSTADNALYALLYSQALDKNYIDVTNDSLINIAVQYYSEHDHDRRLLFLSYFYKGRIYENANRPYDALKIYTTATQHINHFDDNHAKGLLFNRIGKLYYNSYDLDKCIEAYNTSLQYYALSHSDIHYHSTLILTGQAYLESHDFATADSLLNKALVWNYENANWPSCVNCITLLMNLYDYTDDIKALTALQNSKYYIQPTKDLDLLIAEARNAAILKDAQSYNNIIQQAWEKTQSLNDTILVAHIEYLINKDLGNYRWALLNLEYLFNLQDSIVRIELEQPLITAQRDFYQSQATVKELEIQRSRLIFSTITTSIVFLFIIIILIYRHRIIKQKALIAEYINISNDLYESIKNKEHTISNISIQVNELFSKQFSLINQLCATYYEADKQSGKTNIYNEVRKQIKLISQDPKQLIQLVDIINRHKDNVIDIINNEFPQLPEKEFRLICYWYAGFSAKAISVFTQYTVENIYTKKLRFKKSIAKLDSSVADILLKHLY